MTTATRQRRDTRRWKSFRVTDWRGQETWYRIGIQDFVGDQFNGVAGLVYFEGTRWLAEKSFFTSHPPDVVKTEHKTKREATEELLAWADLKWEQRVDLAREADRPDTRSDQQRRA